MVVILMSLKLASVMLIALTQIKRLKEKSRIDAMINTALVFTQKQNVDALFLEQNIHHLRQLTFSSTNFFFR